MCCKKKNKFSSCWTMEGLFNGVSHGLFIISVILAILAVLSIIFNLCPNNDCICDVLLDYGFWAKSFGGCFTLWVIFYNLKKFIDVEAVKALGELREKLNNETNKQVHIMLMSDEDKQDKGNSLSETESADIFNYLGTIELGAIMAHRGTITLYEFYNQFGYRIENLLKYGQLDIKNHIKDSKGYYDAILYIINKLVDEKYMDEKYKID